MPSGVLLGRVHGVVVHARKQGVPHPVICGSGSVQVNWAMQVVSLTSRFIPYEVVATVTGSELTGLHYIQLFPWVNPGKGAFRVIPGDYVTTDDGTGIVHIAGTFGADDLRVSKAAGVPPLHLTDRDGNIRPMVDLRGRHACDGFAAIWIVGADDVVFYGRTDT